ncbi:MAG: hypothetical protein JNL94_15370 [Planctomycetes bacterium]|nr:hypothetical protein [Planctomycetota bacterium]
MLSMLPRSVLMVAAILFALGCSKDNHSHGDSHDHDHSHDEPHASATAEPGSYEDWCGGHGVPESKCTRCNSALVASFKANNDWCAEHELPASQCVKCDPNRKAIRPPKPAGK